MTSQRDLRFQRPRQEKIFLEGIVLYFTTCPGRRPFFGPISERDLSYGLQRPRPSSSCSRDSSYDPCRIDARVDSIAADALARRCSLLREVDVGTLLKEANDAQSTRVANTLVEALALNPSFSKTAWAATLSRAGAMERACKLAFSYGLESDPVVAAEFVAKITLQHRHSHIQIYESKVAPLPNGIPLKSVTDAFSGMPKK